MEKKIIDSMEKNGSTSIIKGKGEEIKTTGEWNPIPILATSFTEGPMTFSTFVVADELSHESKEFLFVPLEENTHMKPTSPKKTCQRVTDQK